MRTFTLFEASITLLLFSLTTVAESPELPTFTVSADVSDTELMAGAPLYVFLTITRGQDKNPEPATVSISSNNNNINIYIEGLNGEELGTRPDWPWSDHLGLGFNLFKNLAAGESYTKSLIVHYWSDTTLPPGRYLVVVEAPRLNYHMENNRREWHPVLDEPFRKAFSVEVLPPDNEHLAQIYNEKLVATKSQDTSWSERYRDLDTIVLAQGPAALGTQLDLLVAMEQDDVRFAYGQKEIVTMLWGIVQRNDISTAHALAELVRGPVFGENTIDADRSGRGIWPMLGWAIHELHRNGNAEVQAVTSSLLDVVPDKPGLVESTFLLGGMQIDREY